MTILLTFFLLFLLPFIILPFGTTQFENPKVIIAESIIILFFFITLFTNKLNIHAKKAFVICYIVVLGLSIVDILFLRSDISLTGNAFRMQGVFLLWFLIIFSYLSSTISFKKMPSIILTTILLIETISLFFLPINESGRYVGTLGEPNALAAFAIFVWPFTFFAIKKFKTKEIIHIGLLLILVGIILFFSDSKSAILAFGIQVVFLLFYYCRVSIRKTILFCLLLYALGYFLPFFQQTVYENRVQVWQSAIIAGLKHPFFGWGIGNIETALHESSQLIGIPIADYYVDSSHNLFLDWWIMGGIIGLEAIVGLFILTGTTFVWKKDIRNLVIFLGMLCVLSFNPASVVGLLGIWWLIGQAAFG